MYKDARDKKYAGVGIDLAAGLAGVGVGIGLGILGGIAISFGIPALAVGVVGFGASVVLSAGIDSAANIIKEWHYRRKE